MSTRKQDRGRFSSKRKMEAVVRLLGGEDLDLLSREVGARPGSSRSGGTPSWRAGMPG